MEVKTFTKDNRSKFIEDNKNFIYNVATYFCNRSLDWNKDQELNIALIAFNRACDSESEVYTSFFSYAYALIQSELIKYHITLQQSKSLTFELENKRYLEYLLSLNDLELHFENKARAMEIALLSQELKKYNINFKYLLEIKFKDKKLKTDLLKLVLSICKDNLLTKSILSKKIRFNSKNLSSLINLEWKIIRKNKKHIIMLILILSSEDYIFLKSYLNIRVGDLND